MLISKTEIQVRFSEIDSLGILWHGHYITYFEDGREAFGKAFNLGYMDVYAEGYSMPVVKVECHFKNPIRYRDRVVVETTFVDSPAAKILFKYRIYNPNSGLTLATGSSQQIFLNRELQLYLTLPDFFVSWKERNGLVASTK